MGSAPSCAPTPVHTPPPHDTPALMRGHSHTSKTQPAQSTSLPSPIPTTLSIALSLPSPISVTFSISLPSPIPLTPKPHNIEIQPPTPTSEVPSIRELALEQHVSDVKPGELEGSSEEERTSRRMDRTATRAAAGLGIDSLQDRVEIARETMERRHEPRFPPGLEHGGSQNKVSAMFHSSKPTKATLVEEPKPERVLGGRDERELETFLEKRLRLPPRGSEKAAFHPSTETLVKEPKPERVTGGRDKRELETEKKLHPPTCASENATFHRSTDTLVKEPKPERVTGGRDERDLEDFLGKLQLQEAREKVAVVVQEEPASLQLQRVAQARWPVLPTASRKLEPGLYTVTDVCWGMSHDLSGAGNRSLIAFQPYGWENQQWEFQSCGAGFVIKGVRTGLFLTLEGPQGVHRVGSTEVVAGQFPMCWQVEIMGNVSANDGDVYARIQLPHTNMTLSFKGGYTGAQLFLSKNENTSTLWRLHAPAASTL